MMLDRIAMMLDRVEGRSIKGFGGSVAVYFVALAVLSGCSDTPSAANPAEWYKSTVDFFSGEDEPEQKAADQGTLAADRGTPAPGADKPFPDLSSVPQGLSGDSKRRRYSSDAIQRQEPSTQVLASPPPPPPAMSQAAPEAPPPPAMPATPVVSVPSPPVASAPPPQFNVPPLPAPGQPAPGLAEKAPPLAGASVYETYMARLSQRYPVKGGLGGARAPTSTPALASRPAPTFSPAPTMLPRSSVGDQATSFGEEDASTVVISSMGVEKGAGSVTFEPVGTPPAPTKPPVLVDITSGAAMAGDASSFLLADPMLAPGAVKVATVQFDNGSASLRSGARRVIGSVYNIYRKKGGKVHVIGHASSRTRNMDPVDHKMVNYRVSAGRADKVARELVRLGVSSKDIIIDAKSDVMPMYYEIMPSGEAGNRRAEIYITN